MLSDDAEELKSGSVSQLRRMDSDFHRQEIEQVDIYRDPRIIQLIVNELQAIEAMRGIGIRSSLSHFKSMNQCEQNLVEVLCKGDPIKSHSSLQSRS